MMTEAVKALLGMMRVEEDFETGARYLSSFFKRTEEHWDAGDVLESLFAADSGANAKIREYILFCFLHVGRSDLDTAASVMRMRRIRILLLRALKSPQTLSDGEYGIVAKMRSEAKLQNMAHFYQMCNDAQTQINMLFDKKALHPQLCSLIALLMECEASALAQRLNYITDRIDPYNLKIMARILPLVTICEERARSYRLLAAAIQKGEEIGKSIISFEYFMKAEEFEKWLARIDKKESLRKLHWALVCQRQKKIPTRALVGISSITRCVLGDALNYSPLDWVLRTLDNSGGSIFKIDCGDMADNVEKLLGGSTIQLRDAAVQGKVAQETFAGLTGADMLTTPAERPEPDPYDLICRAMNNDTLLIRMLDNPKVHTRPGLIEYIAKTSRSISVLTKIASSRALYTGSANMGVPIALLKNPCSIPLSHLRGFVSSKYVSMSDLREISKYGHSVRREVLGEVEEYLKRRS